MTGDYERLLSLRVYERLRARQFVNLPQTCAIDWKLVRAAIVITAIASAFLLVLFAVISAEL